jgi:hypothetical protein
MIINDVIPSMKGIVFSMALSTSSKTLAKKYLPPTPPLLKGSEGGFFPPRRDSRVPNP